MDILNQFTCSLKDKRVLIFGLGLQGGGVGAAKFFSRHTNSIRITDLKSQEELGPSLDSLKGIKYSATFGRHDEADIKWADIVLVNQDVWNKAPDSPYIRLAQELGKQLETETGLFFQLCQCPIIGVTGTRGKTTTATMIAQMLETSGKKVVLGGNIPQSENLEMLPLTHSADYAVLELSNFQLHGLYFKKISPHIAVITSISPDHLISYQSMEAYIEDKKNIYKYQSKSDILVLKDSDIWSKKFASEAKASVHYFSAKTLPEQWKLKVSGQHNRENLGAAYTVGKIIGLEQDVIRQALTAFKGVAYRLEKIKTYRGIDFINDTTASTPTAASIALKAFPANRIVWIAGGNTKNLPLEELVVSASERVRYIVLLKGTGTRELRQLLEKNVPDWEDKFLGEFDDFKAAIETAYKHASAGDTVLLSPAFTSFGMFANEFERGRLFNEYVTSLTSEGK
ncbi:MAG: UDP-N-acetylmuramoyl-L-alanine--D-glutamate ligase [Patescibacteria group bacterium]|jgi:UDP-N-acetylmuramoylalanine--D-glutamate ligase